MTNDNDEILQSCITKIKKANHLNPFRTKFNFLQHTAFFDCYYPSNMIKNNICAKFVLDE